MWFFGLLGRTLSGENRDAFSGQWNGLARLALRLEHWRSLPPPRLRVIIRWEDLFIARVIVLTGEGFAASFPEAEEADEETAFYWYDQLAREFWQRTEILPRDCLETIWLRPPGCIGEEDEAWTEKHY